MDLVPRQPATPLPPPNIPSMSMTVNVSTNLKNRFPSWVASAASWYVPQGYRPLGVSFSADDSGATTRFVHAVPNSSG